MKITLQEPKIAAIVSTHGKPDVTLDTVNSIKRFMTDEIILSVDEAGWKHYESMNLPYPKLKCFYHGCHRANYRNVLLGLSKASQFFPEVDWLCHIEFDCLVGSSAFKEDLAVAEASNVWLLGADFKDKQEVEFPLVEMMLKTKFQEIYYMLGAVLFYHKKFLDKLKSENFFDRFLFYTNEFREGFFPGYEGHDVAEHMIPTLAKHWGGEVQQLVKWDNRWVEGDHRRYPLRWQPELTIEECVQASIMHPLKSFDHPGREFHRTKRQRTI